MIEHDSALFLKGFLFGFMAFPVIFILLMPLWERFPRRRGFFPTVEELRDIILYDDPHIGLFVILPELAPDVTERLREHMYGERRNPIISPVELSPRYGAPREKWNVWCFEKHYSVTAASESLTSFGIRVVTAWPKV